MGLYRVFHDIMDYMSDVIISAPPQKTLRVATYNIHKCQGLDGRVRPGRIVDVLGKIDADIIALQEVVCIAGATPEDDQAEFIAKQLGFDAAFGHTREIRGGRYGNLLLTRFPIHISKNHDLSSPRREPRGCLRADIQLHDTTYHIYNLHLGTGFAERRHQARRILSERIFDYHGVLGPRIVVGDFNEWTRGAVSKLLASQFSAADPRQHLKRSWTYPGVLPFLHLDHIYHDPTLRLKKLTLHRDRLSLVASDHLPLVADFVAEDAAEAKRPLIELGTRQLI